MHVAAGILTARGGMTSHAAVVARGWGKCCISGCADIRVNDAEKVEFGLLLNASIACLFILKQKRELLFHCRAGCCDWRQGY